MTQKAFYWASKRHVEERKWQKAERHPEAPIWFSDVHLLMCRSLLVMGTDVYPTVSQSTSGQAFDEVIAELIKQHIFPPLLSALFQISIKLLLSYVLNPFVYCTSDAPFEFSNY